MNRILAFLFTLLLIMSPAVAQEQKAKPKELEVITKAWPEPYAVSHNIVFVVDASSTINWFPSLKRKFNFGWDFITQQFAADELYFRVYVFHDPHRERRTKWVNAGGPKGELFFKRAKKWIRQNTGVRSWGLKAIRMALREKNPLDKNPATARRLTIVLFTDGGLSEAATPVSDGEETLKSTLKNHQYQFTGSFDTINKMIRMEQNLRKKRELEEATIITIGFKNLEADARYGLDVKQRDPDCQAWLNKLGKQYHGGNFLIRKKK
jgi:hypothetical protein